MSKPFPINHDLHCHSRLSSCCHDDSLTVDSIMTFAKAHQYDLVAVTDHFWDSTVPGANNWYAPQNLKHIQQSLPLPRDEKVRFLFGCETEYCGGGKLGIAPEHFPLFDIIVIPVNHFHMEGFVRPSSCDTPEKLAELLTERLEELCQLSLPWEKVGIAHLNGCFFLKGEGYSRNMRLISEDRVRAVFRFFAEKGAGIELNASTFPPDWRENEDTCLRLLRFAREEGCTFYCGSDAHSRESLSRVPDRLGEVAALLGLTEDDLFMK